MTTLWTKTLLFFLVTFACRRVHEGKQLKEDCNFCGKQVYNLGTTVSKPTHPPCHSHPPPPHSQLKKKDNIAVSLFPDFVSMQHSAFIRVPHEGISPGGDLLKCQPSDKPGQPGQEEWALTSYVPEEVC
jgi:hypothetical protein